MLNAYGAMIVMQYRSYWLWSGALVVAALGVFGYYRSDMRLIERNVRESSVVVHTPCGPIEYAARGTGTPVLIIHGAGGGYDQGLLLADGLPSGFQVIAPSRFGYLRTPVAQDTSVAAQAAAHGCLLDALGIERSIVVGVSAGATSATELAIQQADRVIALILLVPSAYAPDHEVKPDASASSQVILKIIMAGADFAFWSAMHIARPLVVRFLGVLPEIEQKASRDEREKVTRTMDAVLPVSWRLAGLQIDSSLKLERRPLERITAPTLVVSAQDDLFNTLPAAQFIAKQIPNARLIIYETGGHLLVGRDQELRASVQLFLSAAATAIRIAPASNYLRIAIGGLSRRCQLSESGITTVHALRAPETSRRRASGTLRKMASDPGDRTSYSNQAICA